MTLGSRIGTVSDAGPAHGGVTVRRITVIGGGFTGAIFAQHLLKLAPAPVAIDVVEERDRLGAGVAYSAAEPHQTTNIPAIRMSVDPADPEDFARWLAARPALATAGAEYPNRFVFGTYVSERLTAAAAAHPESTLHHRRTRAATVRRGPHGFTIVAADGTRWNADAVVLATGNPLPAPPAALARLAGDPRVVLDPWGPNALDRIASDDSVLVVGIGLSMGEAVAGLRARGHRGPVTAIARRGRRPERGLVPAVPPFGDFGQDLPTTAVGILQRFRSEVRRAAAAGLTWRSVLVAARADAWALWANLPARERRRFVRHLRPWWEALRHVMPGPVHDQLAAEERDGRLRIVAASLRDLAATPDGLVATLHARHAPPEAVEQQRVDAILNCTGPAYATLTRTDPFWAGLAEAGLVTPDVVQLGIAVDAKGRAVTPTGASQDDLLVLGTLARGTFGELTGIAELSRQALVAAEALVAAWRAPAVALRWAG